ncbi:sugar ABC transporter permease [Catenulispora subtropica]|uniref:Sugar ABC transporter permease n=1 Tax=Catenulispora subtropica TaxID=450798 RepID=A0ABN2T2B5_9ACTN
MDHLAPPMSRRADLVSDEHVRQAAKRRRRRISDLTGWGFIGVPTLVVVGLSLFPAAWAFYISLHKWNLLTPAKPIGMRNYQRIGDDPDALSAVWNTVFFTAVFVPVSIILGILLAVALNQKIRFSGFYRTAIFVPFVASAAATGILAGFVFEPNYGVANDVLRRLHLHTMKFLESPTQAMIVLVIIALWGQIGFTVVVYLAALQDIPKETIEAAIVDGANRRQVFRHVTLPELAPVTVFTAVWQTITALQLFDLVYTTTRGGPMSATETIVYYVYKVAFQESRFGYGAALSYLLFAVTMLVTLFMIWYSRRAKVEAF